jgi:hypothetical protein
MKNATKAQKTLMVILSLILIFSFTVTACTPKASEKPTVKLPGSAR